MQFDRLAYENGLIARCMGDVLGFSRRSSSRGDVDEIAERCATSLKQLERDLRVA